MCQNPPLELSLDGSTGASEDHEVEEGGDGVWSVVGGKVGIFFFFPLSSYFSQNDITPVSFHVKSLGQRGRNCIVLLVTAGLACLLIQGTTQYIAGLLSS